MEVNFGVLQYVKPEDIRNGCFKCPNEVKRIGSFAFVDCYNLKEVFIPTSVKSIGNNAFARCESLEQIVFNEGLESIGECAFANCSRLGRRAPFSRAIALPASVKYIGDGAFEGCSSLKTIFLKDETGKKFDASWLYRKTAKRHASINFSLAGLTDCCQFALLQDFNLLVNGRSVEITQTEHGFRCKKFSENTFELDSYIQKNLLPMYLELLVHQIS